MTIEATRMPYDG